MTAYVPRVYDASASYDQFVHRARARRAQAPRANRYPGPCALCGGRVEAGHLAGGKPQHTPGTCPADPAPAYRENRFAGPCASAAAGSTPAPAASTGPPTLEDRHVGTCPGPAEPAGPGRGRGLLRHRVPHRPDRLRFWQVERGSGQGQAARSSAG